MTTDYKVKLEIFEGPLDLLLYLIKRDELDIYDISIERITKQYLEYLEPAIAQFLNGKPIARADTPSFGCAIETVYYQLPKQL